MSEKVRFGVSASATQQPLFWVGKRHSNSDEAPPSGKFSMSAIGEFGEHLRVATLRRAPADEILAGQLMQIGEQRRLACDPCAIFRDHLVTRAVAADHERIA